MLIFIWTSLPTSNKINLVVLIPESIQGFNIPIDSLFGSKSVGETLEPS